MTTDYTKLVADLQEQSPNFWNATAALSAKWLTPLIARLDRKSDLPTFPKIFNDPVWGTVELMPWEVVLLDSPLIQRLRGVRQLGMAHYVYPGGGHDRLEHVRGVVEAAEQIIRQLERNAEHRKEFSKDAAIPQVSKLDRYAIRLAALLHDMGHGPFSHAIEPIIEQKYSAEFRKLQSVLRTHFDGVANVSISEAIAALIVLSSDMQKVINHSSFCFPEKTEYLELKIVARIIGARNHLDASYLSGVISGPVDADKFDYMARDSLHAGLPISLDTSRLISKLEVITITPESVQDSELLKRVQEAPHKRIYEIGIAVSGIGSYEQMLVNRVILYDRLYYHQKVRTADAMVQRLVFTAGTERGRQFSIEELFLDVGDDTMISLIGGRLKSDNFGSGGAGAKELSENITSRRLYRRAHAFAVRFISGFEGWEDKQKEHEKAALWRQVTRSLASFEDIQKFEESILEIAKEIGLCIGGDLGEMAAALRQEHIIADLPMNKIQPAGNLLHTRTETDQVGSPNLYFDPEKWSNAYDQQKRCGYIFCPHEYRSLVSIAAKVAFFRRYRLVMNENSDRFTKMAGSLKPEWLQKLYTENIIDAECHTQLLNPKTSLAAILPNAIQLPEKWLEESPDKKKELSDAIRLNRPGGFVSSVHEATTKLISAMARFIDMNLAGGEILRKAVLPEKELQEELRKHLRILGHEIGEGSLVAGGAIDLIADNLIIIENKVDTTPTDSPMESKQDSPFQARRYTLGVCRSVFFTVVAYQPRTEAGLLPAHKSIQVLPADGMSDCIQVRVVIPYNQSVPSAAKAPKP